MGTIGNTLGIVGRGRAVDNLIRAIAEGAIPLEGINRIVFYNHTEGREKDEVFREKILKKEILITKKKAKDILESKKIELEVDDNFPTFYGTANVVFFAAGMSLYKPIVANPSVNFFDILWKTFNKVVPFETYFNREPFYGAMVELLDKGYSQHDFFSKVSEMKDFKQLEDADKTKWALDEKITFESMKIIFDMVRNGKFPHSYRTWCCFAPSLAMLIHYGQQLYTTLLDTNNKPKPILVLTNEPSMACNIFSLINPNLTPFLLGVNDYDSGRIKEMFAGHFRLNQKELDIGLIGDHESYALPVFKQKSLKDNSGNKIDEKKAHIYFRNALFSYVVKEFNNLGDPNVSVRDSLISIINAATRSLGNCLRFEGDFYNGVFVPLNRTLNTQGYSYSREIEESVREGRLKLEENTGIFATYHHSFCNGRAIPLTCEVSEYAQRQFVKCLAGYITLLCKLITNDVIGEQLFVPITDSGTRERIWNLPYVEMQTTR